MANPIIMHTSFIPLFPSSPPPVLSEGEGTGSWSDWDWERGRISTLHDHLPA